MTDERKAAIRAAISTLDMSNEDHVTNDGAPDVHAINDAMPDGSDRVTAAERNEVWAEMSAPAEPPAPEIEPMEPQGDSTRIVIETSFADPVPVYVHGCGARTLPVGEEIDVEPAILEALRNASGLTYREVK